MKIRLMKKNSVIFFITLLFSLPIKALNFNLLFLILMLPALNNAVLNNSTKEKLITFIDNKISEKLDEATFNGQLLNYIQSLEDRIKQLESGIEEICKIENAPTPDLSKEEFKDPQKLLRDYEAYCQQNGFDENSEDSFEEYYQKILEPVLEETKQSETSTIIERRPQNNTSDQKPKNITSLQPQQNQENFDGNSSTEPQGDSEDENALLDAYGNLDDEDLLMGSYNLTDDEEPSCSYAASLSQ